MYGKYFRKYRIPVYDNCPTTRRQVYVVHVRTRKLFITLIPCLVLSYDIIVVVVRVVSSTCVKIISYEDIMHITNEVKVLLTYCTCTVRTKVHVLSKVRKYESTKVRKYLISCTKVTTYYLRTTITVLYINKITYLY